MLNLYNQKVLKKLKNETIHHPKYKHWPLAAKRHKNKRNANRAKSTVTKYKEWCRSHLQLGGTLMEFFDKIFTMINILNSQILLPLN